MNKKIETIQKNSLISFETTFSFSPMPGWKKYIVTKDKKLYIFEYYYRVTPFMEKNNIPKESSFECELTEKQYKEIVQFIEQKIIGKKFEPIFMTDGSYSIKVENYNILNHVDLYNTGFDIIKNIMNKKRK